MGAMQLIRLLLGAGIASPIGSSSSSTPEAGISSCSGGGVQDFPYQFTNNNVTAIGPDMAEDPFAAESVSTCGKAWCAEADLARLLTRAAG